MDQEIAKKEISDLSRKITKAQYEYYVLGQPGLSDREFDKLYDRLVELETQFPQLKSQNSPSLRVGSDLNNDFPQAEHTIPVLSLDKAYNLEEIQQWIERCRKTVSSGFSCFVEEKIDGISLVLYYENGSLVRGLTRGNGEVGNDITANVRTIPSIPLELGEDLSGAVRGEVFIQKDDFMELNSKLEEPYVNPRNFAGGSLRRIKSSDVAKIPLRFFAYESYFDTNFTTHEEKINQLESLHFVVNNRNHSLLINSDSDNSDEIEKLARFLEKETKERKDLLYEIDGLVIKINEDQHREDLGYTGHHPRWAIAYKFESPSGITKVLDIDFQVGRTGRISPVARVAPVEVGGSTIQNITLHNEDYINLLEVAPGDEVRISRRGDVIPAVEEVLEKGEHSQIVASFPDQCPSCSQKIEKIGSHHYCVNPQCPEQIRQKLIFFCAKDQMDIENMGAETVSEFWKRGYIKSLPDIFKLPYDEIQSLAGFGERKIQLIKAGIEKAKERPYTRVLASLGIKNLGPKVIELIIDAGYRTIDSLFSLLDQGKLRDLEEINGIGPKLIDRIEEEFSKVEFKGLINNLKDLGLKFEAAEIAPSNLPQIFEDQIWCITGSFEHFKPRSLAAEEAKQRGASVTSSVTGKTTHLLAGEGAGSKLTKAQELDVQIVTEEDFLRLIKG